MADDTWRSSFDKLVAERLKSSAERGQDLSFVATMLDIPLSLADQRSGNRNGVDDRIAELYSLIEAARIVQMQAQLAYNEDNSLKPALDTANMKLQDLERELASKRELKAGGDAFSAAIQAKATAIVSKL